MIAEQAADADRPHRPRLDQRREPAARGGVDEAEAAADGEGQRRQFERRNRAGRSGQQRQHRPQRNRAEADEGRGGRGGGRCVFVRHGPAG